MLVIAADNCRYKNQPAADFFNDIETTLRI